MAGAPTGRVQPRRSARERAAPRYVDSDSSGSPMLLSEQPRLPEAIRELINTNPDVLQWATGFEEAADSHGRVPAFHVADCDAFQRLVFENTIFKLKDWDSIKRTANYWGFGRNRPPGSRRATFSHAIFCKDRPDLDKEIGNSRTRDGKSEHRQRRMKQIATELAAQRKEYLAAHGRPSIVKQLSTSTDGAGAGDDHDSGMPPRPPVLHADNSLYGGALAEAATAPLDASGSLMSLPPEELFGLLAEQGSLEGSPSLLGARSHGVATSPIRSGMSESTRGIDRVAADMLGPPMPAAMQSGAAGALNGNEERDPSVSALAASLSHVSVDDTAARMAAPTGREARDASMSALTASFSHVSVDDSGTGIADGVGSGVPSVPSSVLASFDQFKPTRPSAAARASRRLRSAADRNARRAHVHASLRDPGVDATSAHGDLTAAVAGAGAAVGGPATGGRATKRFTPAISAQDSVGSTSERNPKVGRMGSLQDYLVDFPDDGGDYGAAFPASVSQAAAPFHGFGSDAGGRAQLRVAPPLPPAGPDAGSRSSEFLRKDAPPAPSLVPLTSQDGYM